MAETSLDVQSTPRWIEEEVATPDTQNAAMKIQRAKDVYDAYLGFEEEPKKAEVLSWYLYELSSYFIHTVFLPILFPLMISQIKWHEPEMGRSYNNRSGLLCRAREVQLYQELTNSTIAVKHMSFSALEWTSISWVFGIILASPVLASIAVHLDHGHSQQFIAIGATAVGALFCLPAGFFQTHWIFPIYIAAVVIASTVSTSSHTRNLGLMVRGFLGTTIPKSKFPCRQAIASWLSLYGTAAGCVGSAIMSSFTYYMLHHKEDFVSLWIVSIFSGLKWLLGILHVLMVNRPGVTTAPLSSPSQHLFSIFKHPHAAGSLVGVLLSSFTTMSIFTAGVLYLVGYLCLKPTTLLYVWLMYFLFPLFSLPLLQPLQQIIRADAVRMQLLGFLISSLTSGTGFYYRGSIWKNQHVLFFAAIQSLATGVLHAFGRVLLLDCTPPGKDGAFSIWYSWVRAIGTCAGFALASAIPGNIQKTFGTVFCISIIGIVVLIFGNISNLGGAVAAGHVREEFDEKRSPVHGLDNGREVTEANVQTVRSPQEETV
ncbi:hypothetical protein RJ641_000812 [Dillenia turbinata]|uniref:Uncharacterized protein n=1 Tax=Dillenia turbinata TaxID=194707 RepID=A0AAN8ZMP3_9MAGN